MSGHKAALSGKVYCHPGTRFACACCGKCCTVWDIPITRAEKQRLEEKASRLEEDLGPKETWFLSYRHASLFLLNKRETRCIFLGSDNLCTIHKLLGEEFKPLACRLYPFNIFAWKDGSSSASWHYDCPAVGGSNGKDLPSCIKEINGFAREIADVGRLVSAEYGSGRKEKPSIDQLRIIAAGYQKFLIFADFPPAVRIYAAARLLEFHSLKGHRTDIVEAGDWFIDDAFNFVSRSIEDLRLAISQAPPLNANMRVVFRYLLSGYARSNEEPLARFLPFARFGRVFRTLSFILGSGSLKSFSADSPDSSGNEPLAILAQMPCDESEVMPPYWDFLAGKLASLHFCGGATLRLNFQEGMRHLLLSYPVARCFAALFAASEKRDKVNLSDLRRALILMDHTFSRSPFFALQHVRRMESKLCSGDALPSLLRLLSSQLVV
ncbi:MAG: hypothetical protein A2X49_16955 [Lentisphaerae bacterium GWF2_52_8]|nr:MAG: hypothetical protein A2X49_16955 [Lentisphaerae bacterium GWF2_52_8]